MVIVFRYQGDEVYSIELPDGMEKATFKFAESSVYDGITIPIPVISEIVMHNN